MKSRFLSDFLFPLLRDWKMEPALVLYMFSSNLQMPVFQNLLFEKSCWAFYQDDVLCRNVSAYYEDDAIQADANRLFFISSIIQILPSIPSSLLLGALVDKSRLRLSLMIPFGSLLLATSVYIILSIIEHSSPYYLFIADIIFGVCGGYSSIIGVSVAYSVRDTSGSLRSSRMARLEGCIGLGGTIGYALSGTIRKAFGYTAVFCTVLGLQIASFIYILIFVRDDDLVCRVTDEEAKETYEEPSLMRRWIVDPVLTLVRVRPLRLVLIALFIAFGLDLYAVSGLSDIQYSLMRYRLSWDDSGYGPFSALTSLFGTIGALFLYPLLRMAFADVLLGSVGLVFKMTFLIVLTITRSRTLIYILTVLYIGNRFVSTAFRTQIANLVEEDEQGKISSLVSILEGVAGVLATASLNNLYPLTLKVWDGICPIVIVCLLFIALLVLIFSRIRLGQAARQEAREICKGSETKSSSIESVHNEKQ